MKYTLFLEDENGNRVNFSDNPDTVKLIAENIDFDTMDKVMLEYLPSVISARLKDVLDRWNKYQDALRNLSGSVNPRTVWVNEKKLNSDCPIYLSEKCYGVKEQAERHSEVFDSMYIRTVKFQEVIE